MENLTMTIYNEIRYLEKLKSSKVTAGYKDAAEESGIKQRSLSLVLKVRNNENAKNSGPLRSDKNGKKAKLERVREDTYNEHEEELMSEEEAEGIKEKLVKDITDSPTENKNEIVLQRVNEPFYQAWISIMWLEQMKLSFQIGCRHLHLEGKK